MFYNFLFYLFERKYILDEMVYVWILFDIFNFDYFVSFFFYIDNLFMCYFNFKNEWNVYKLFWLFLELKRLFYGM